MRFIVFILDFLMIALVVMIGKSIYDEGRKDKEQELLKNKKKGKKI